MSAVAYLDTCVWLSALFSNDINHPKAMQVLQNIKNGKHQVFITHHVLCEILDVLKKKIAISAQNNPTQFEALVRSRFQSFIFNVLQMPNVAIKNPHAASDLIFRPSFIFLMNYLGNIQKVPQCPICGGSFNYASCDTIFEPDALHASLASKLNCDLFITFDKDFAQLKNDSEIAPMTIQVM